MTFFDLTHQDKKTKARTGIVHTDHGGIETPAFMPVGTQASVKTLDQTDLENIGAQIILGNTYHLHLRPGEDLIHEAGGLHKFMNWNHPILTDSGGFQVFSLGLQKEGRNKNGEKLVTIDEDGATFRSHIDGSTHRFTPESAIEIQHKIGADIIMAFDECTPDNIEEKYTREAMERTHRWAKRCLAEHIQLSSRQSLAATRDLSQFVGDRFLTPATGIRNDNKPYRQFLFGIIQGANYQHLREESARYISSLNFDGIAIGGESVGYNMEATKNILDWVCPIIPQDKPRYTMGLGSDPYDLIIAVEHGADMFDCVAPTRLARHGVLFTYQKNTQEKHNINITNAKFISDTRPIDENCQCPTCLRYSRSYLHHLFNAQETSALRLASIHNLYFMLNLMRQTREVIKNDSFAEFKKQWE